MVLYFFAFTRKKKKYVLACGPRRLKEQQVTKMK